MHGQRVVVVGGSSGIGLGVARAALREGADVIIAGRSQARLDDALAVLRAHESERTASAVAADIMSEADVVRLFATVGSFDHLVSTAADLVYQPIAELDLDAARHAVESKLLSSLLLAKHGSRQIQRSGSITFTSGIAAYRPGVRGSAVTAAVNSALSGLSRALAVELAPLRVNVVSPGWVDTPIWNVFAGDRKTDIQAEMAGRLPAGRIGLPEDIAHAFLFLMQNGFTTGSVLHVDGGQRLV